MRKALATLLRVRSVHKKMAEREFGTAERARNQQEELIEGLYSAMDGSHSGDEMGYPGGEAAWLAIEHSYRLKMQVRIRREKLVLQERAKIAADKRQRLVEADRRARVVELALEKRDAQLALEERRAESRRIDGLAAERWWRKERS